MKYSGSGTPEEIRALQMMMQAIPPAVPVSNEQVLLSMRLVPSLQVVDTFRSFVVVYMTRRFSRQLGDKLGTACHELLENAVNHGTSGLDVHVEVRTNSSGGVEILVANECVEERANALHERVQQLVGTNTAELYRSALRGSPGTKSMLGLVRVRHEAGMTLEAASEGAQVVVVARMRLTSQR
ncbi:MAG TPA: ATP-binding protein [Polyangium sp.]|nr:ATP-binding protein [Polyangium sp.]